MKFIQSQLLGGLLLLPTTLSASLAKRKIIPYQNSPVFTSSSDFRPPGTMYGRSIQLTDSSILTTWENYSPEPPLVYFPIFRSTDYGRTYTNFSQVTDQTRNMGMRYQPDLFQLPGPLGNLPAGTVLLSGNAIPSDLSSTHLELYASTDGGKSWSFVSHIADGGEALPNNGLTPIWEPFIFYRDGALTIFYSDQRDPAHGQKLVHQTTKDGIHWAPAVNDVRYSNYTARPGMPTIARLNDGRWIMTFELVNPPLETQQTGVPVYYKLSDDPLSWDDKEPILLRPEGDIRPQGTPYVNVGKDGKILVSSNTESAVFVNDGDAHPDKWRLASTAQKKSYSRCLTMINEAGNEKQYLLLTSGGEYQAHNSINTVATGVEDFNSW